MNIEENVVIKGRKLSPEVAKFAYLIQKGIDDNECKDNNGVRGWKTDTPEMGLFKVGGEMSDVLTTFSHMNHPIGGDERNAPTPQKLAKEAADLAAQVLFFVDQCGGLEVS
jgi:hypothetical protein